MLAAAACLLATLPLSVRLLLVALTTLHYVYFLRARASAQTGAAVRAVAWDNTRGWQVCCSDGSWQRAELRIPVFVSVPLVIMRFRVSTGRTCSAMVVADRLSTDEFRRLRVCLLQAARANRK